MNPTNVLLTKEYSEYNDYKLYEEEYSRSLQALDSSPTLEAVTNSDKYIENSQSVKPVENSLTPNDTLQEFVPGIL